MQSSRPEFDCVLDSGRDSESLEDLMLLGPLDLKKTLEPSLKKVLMCGAA